MKTYHGFEIHSAEELAALYNSHRPEDGWTVAPDGLITYKTLAGGPVLWVIMLHDDEKKPGTYL